MKPKTSETPANVAAGQTSGVVVQRLVSLSADRKSCIGEWAVNCDTCPLLPHLKALGQEPRACTAGMQTNIQGAIPLATCEYLVKDSITKLKGKLYINCTHVEANMK